MSSTVAALVYPVRKWALLNSETAGTCSPAPVVRDPMHGNCRKWGVRRAFGDEVICANVTRWAACPRLRPQVMAL